MGLNPTACALYGEHPCEVFYRELVTAGYWLDQVEEKFFGVAMQEGCYWVADFAMLNGGLKT